MTALKFHASYLSDAFQPSAVLVSKAAEILGSRKFDTLVGIGMSGALVIPRLAEALNVHWMIVRKESDNTHSWRGTEGTLGKRWLFVDDLIESGATYGRVRDQVEFLCSSNDYQSKHVGVYLYHNYGAPAFLSPAAALDIGT